MKDQGSFTSYDDYSLIIVVAFEPVSRMDKICAPVAATTALISDRERGKLVPYSLQVMRIVSPGSNVSLPPKNIFSVRAHHRRDPVLTVRARLRRGPQALAALVEPAALPQQPVALCDRALIDHTARV